MRYPSVMGLFLRSVQADVAILRLLEIGLRADDLTLLVCSEEKPNHLDLILSAARPEQNTHKQLDGSERYESPVGAGIETSSADDDVSSVEEMDDSQTYAESMSYPASGRSYGVSDMDELRAFDRHGSLDRTALGRSPAAFAESPITEVELPGLGRLIGEGSFGEALLVAAFGETHLTVSELLITLGFSARAASISRLIINQGGSLLVCDARADGPGSEAMLDTLISAGASHAESARIPARA